MREEAVRQKFIVDREDFAEIQELRGGVKDSVANIPVKENPVLARPSGPHAEEPEPEAEPEANLLGGTGMRLDDEEGA